MTKSKKFDSILSDTGDDSSVELEYTSFSSIHSQSLTNTVEENKVDAPQRKDKKIFKDINQLGGSFELKLMYDWNDYLRNEYEIEFDCRLYAKLEKKAKKKEFKLIKTIDCGAFSRVMLAKRKDTNLYYAIKLYRKSLLVKLNVINNVENERKIMASVRFPLIVHTEYFFQDFTFLYIVFPLCLAGNMAHYIKKYSTLSEEHAKFVTAQVILAIEYLHVVNIMYRNLKPENVLIDHDGFIKISDFTLSKYLYNSTRTYSLCGKPEYIPPEMLTTSGHGKPVDFWQLGVFIYEIISGFTPYSHQNILEVYKNILDNNYEMLSDISKPLKNFIFQLLITIPDNRIGVGGSGIADIKNHPWFKNIIWINMINRNCKAPFVPDIKHVEDTTYFSEYEEESFDIETKPKWLREFNSFY